MFIFDVFRKHKMYQNDDQNSFDAVGNKVVVSQKIFRINDIETQDKIYGGNNKAGGKTDDGKCLPVPSAEPHQQA